MGGMLRGILSFPGVIVHELAHAVACRLCGVRVVKVCYFRLGNPAGYVLHEAPRAAWQHVLIGVGPFFLNTLLAAAIGVYCLTDGQRALSPRQLALYWLGITIAMHAFPSTGDARGIWQRAWSRGTPWLVRLLATPLVGLIYLLALGTAFWLDLLYAAAVTLLAPHWLLAWLRAWG